MTGSSLRKCRVVASLAVLAFFSGCTYWTQDFERIVDQTGRDFRHDPGKTYVDIDYEALTINPTAYKLLDVRFYALFDRHDEKIFLTMYSTFRQEDFYSFSLWPIGARLWDADGRRSLPTFYVRKDNRDLQKVLDTPRYSVIEIRGRVMGDFDNIPFVEVFYFDKVDSPLYDDEAVADLGGGLDATAQKRPAQAIPRLERALEGRLDSPGRYVAYMTLGRLFEERGDFDAAIENYDEALSLDPYSDEAAAALERAEKALEQKRARENP